MRHRLEGFAVLAAILLAAATAGAQAPAASKGHAAKAEREIREFFAAYLRLHAAKQMDAWQALFLPEAICVRTGRDGHVIQYRAADLAARIAEEAKKLESQHETFEDVRIEVEGDAGMYATLWKLYHNGQKVRQGRAWFSLVKMKAEGRQAGSSGAGWRIAALVWYNQ